MSIYTPVIPFNAPRTPTRQPSIAPGLIDYLLMAALTVAIPVGLTLAANALGM